MTLVAAVPELRKQFFDPTVVKVGETEHLIIGVSKAKHSIKDAEGLAEYMITRCLESLQISFTELHVKAPDQSASSTIAEVPTPPPRTVVNSIH